jgi:hypothetical protein
MSGRRSRADLPVLQRTGGDASGKQLNLRRDFEASGLPPKICNNFAPRVTGEKKTLEADSPGRRVEALQESNG